MAGSSRRQLAVRRVEANKPATDADRFLLWVRRIRRFPMGIAANLSEVVMRHYRRPSLVIVCLLGGMLAGSALADDDKHKHGQSGAMGQSPASMSAPAAPHPPAAHAPGPQSPASPNSPATPDVMASHMEEMATMMRERGKAMEAMGHQMQEGSTQMHQQAMSMKAGDTSTHNDMDMSAAMQHMEQMKKDMENCERQMQQVDSTMQKMDSSMGGGMAKKKMGHM